MKEMEWSDSLNKISTYVIPFLDDNLTREDVSIESGFVDAYTEDINRPWHTNCIFLLYKLSDKDQAFYTFRKLMDLETLKTWYPLKIKGEHYRMFVFHRCTSSINIKLFLESGRFPISEKTANKFIHFWKDCINEKNIRPVVHTSFDDRVKIKYVTPKADVERFY